MSHSTVNIAPFVVGLLAWFGTATSSSLADSHNWPQWQGPTRNGLTSETGLLKSWPEDGPKRIWLFDNCGSGYSGPAIVDNRLYILGSRDGTCELIAIDADTGREIWSTELGDELKNDWGNGPRGTPTVDGNFVYALSGSGALACVRADDGSAVWRTTMKELGGNVPFWGYSSSVLIDGDKLICTPGGPQGAVAALDKKNGKVLWQSSDVTDDSHYSSVVRGEFHGKPAYVQLLEKRLVGLSPEDGSLLWETDFPGNVAVIPTPIVHDNRVFVTAGYGAGCKLVEIGKDNEVTVVYEDNVMKNHHGGVILLGDHLYGHSDGVGWMCLDWASGKPAWRERGELGKGAIAYADGRFYCLDEEEGNVALIDASPEAWEERGRFTLQPQSEIRSDRGKIWTHPVIVGGKLYLRDQDLLYCYDVTK